MTVRRPVGETYAELARAHGVRVEPADLARAFTTVFPAMPPLSFDRPFAEDRPEDAAELDRLERGWWRTLVERAMAHAAAGDGAFEDFDAFFTVLYAHYADSRAWALYPETLDVLDALRARAIPTAVVSNFDSRLERLAPALGIAQRVDHVICSTRAGSAKPSRAIFDLATSRLESDPGRTVHVGDSPGADVEGAANAGLIALLVDRSERYEHAAGERSIRSLDELLGWLDRLEWTA